MLGRDARPFVVVERPGGDAMDVGDVLELRLGHEVGPLPDERRLDGALDFKLPFVLRDVRLQAEIEHRPFLDQALAGRQSLLMPRVGPAGEILAGGGFRLLLADQLVFDLAEDRDAVAAVVRHGPLPA